MFESCHSDQKQTFKALIIQGFFRFTAVRWSMVFDYAPTVLQSLARNGA